MARLNEPAVPAESVDSLKRRFLRQNRELAKANSSQSIRIRYLEDQVRRLLDENATLSEEIIALKIQLENAPSNSSIAAWRGACEGKLKELQALIGGIDQLGKQTSERRAKGNAPERWKALRDWPKRYELDPEHLLPTIRESKTYPRTTLEAAEIQGFANPAGDSPDIGPPPVAHYDDDPVKYDPVSPSAALDTGHDGNKDESGIDRTMLPANFETRRKRKDGGPKLEIRRASVFKTPDEGSKQEIVLPIRAGAKRKLDARDDITIGQEESPATSFEFSRKEDLSSKAASDKDGPSKLPAMVRRTSTNIEPKPKPRSKGEKLEEASQERKALGEKSVNTDPVVSPRKTCAKSALEKDFTKKPSVTDFKDPAAKLLAKGRKLRVEKVPEADMNAEPVYPVEIDDSQPLSVPPKTPGVVDDLFSPLSTNPSTSKEAPKDTPPPSDLTCSTTASITEQNGRHARRARAQVNYAEPSLNTKMRRPTKALVDAVDRSGRPIGGVVTSNHGRESLAKVKKEGDDHGELWKQLPSISRTDSGRGREEPGSPLSAKGKPATDGDARTHREITTKADDAGSLSSVERMNSGTQSQPRIRSVSSLTLASATEVGNGSTSRASKWRTRHSSTPSLGSILQSTASARDPQHRPASSEDPDDKAHDPLAIFDFTESSPSDLALPTRTGSTRVSLDKTRQADTGKRRVALSRRHSALAISADAAEKAQLRTEAVQALEGKEKMDDERPEEQGEEAAEARAARAASRRRSMML